jgi:mono/diheme cytochrome c family protein
MGMAPHKNGKQAGSAQQIVLALSATLSGCAMATTPNLVSPLGAFLSPAAMTGAPVALRTDPNAKVIISTAKDLPAASYLPSQAERGAKIYAQTCGTCHGPGTLVGEGFVTQWNDRRVYDLYALVRGTMPLDNPAGMKDGEYLDVIAYLLHANKHRSSGTDSLRADTTALRKTRIAVGTP